MSLASVQDHSVPDRNDFFKTIFNTLTDTQLGQFKDLASVHIYGVQCDVLIHTHCIASKAG